MRTLLRQLCAVSIAWVLASGATGCASPTPSPMARDFRTFEIVYQARDIANRHDVEPIVLVNEGHPEYQVDAIKSGPLPRVFGVPVIRVNRALIEEFHQLIEKENFFGMAKPVPNARAVFLNDPLISSAVTVRVDGKSATFIRYAIEEGASFERAPSDEWKEWVRVEYRRIKAAIAQLTRLSPRAMRVTTSGGAADQQFKSWKKFNDQQQRIKELRDKGKSGQ